MKCAGPGAAGGLFGVAGGLFGAPGGQPLRQNGRMLALRDCVGDRAAAAGRKACRLAEALHRGLRIPDGFVLLPDEPLPTPAQLEAALAALSAISGPVPAPPPGARSGAAAPPGPGPRFAVRSSAALEDQADRSAAGLFCSRVDVAAADVAAALAAVRASGESEAVRAYAGGPVKVAVLVQPMVAAERLGVLLLDDDGGDGDGAGAVCEERAPGTPEWGEVTVRSPSPAAGAGPDAGLDAAVDAELLGGARALAALLAAELGRTGPTLVEYARGPGAAVTFLQVRPAPRPPEDRSAAAWAGALPPPLAAHELVFDRDHNPDPLSAAQAGLVERLSPAPGASGDDGGDGAPGLVQAVVRGYLYYALPVAVAGVAGAAGAAGAAGLPLAALAERFRGEIAPAWEAALQPLEAKLAAADGALRPELQAWRAASLSSPKGRAGGQAEGRDALLPGLLTELLPAVSLDAALAAYAAVFRRYVGELSPSLRRARAHLDQLLRSNLGEPLSRHGELVAALGGVQLERLQALWELGRAGAEADALRRYLARHGAWAPAWDVACACDDERPEPVRQQALRLGRDPRSPRERHEAAQAPFPTVFAANDGMALGAVEFERPVARWQAEARIGLAGVEQHQQGSMAATWAPDVGAEHAAHAVAPVLRLHRVAGAAPPGQVGQAAFVGQAGVPAVGQRQPAPRGMLAGDGGGSSRLGAGRAVGRVLAQVLGRALRHQLAAALPALGAEVDDPVGTADHVQVVLDDDQRMPGVEQLAQRPHQLGDVVEMQAGGRLVEEEERAAFADALRGRGRLGQETRQLQALRLAAGQRGDRLPEAHVFQADVDDGLQLGDDLAVVREELDGFADGQVQHVGHRQLPRPAHQLDLQHDAAEAAAVAVGAAQVDVGEELHLHVLEAAAAAGGAAAVAGIEAEHAGAVVALDGQRCLGEQLAHLVPDAEEGGGRLAHLAVP